MAQDLLLLIYERCTVVSDLCKNCPPVTMGSFSSAVLVTKRIDFFFFKTANYFDWVLRVHDTAPRALFCCVTTDVRTDTKVKNAGRNVAIRVMA
jgi:hypothetical protein